MAGITSARDLGGPLKESIDVRDRINRGEIPGPTLYVAGPFIQHEPYPGTELFRWGVKGPADGKAKVKQLADAGVNIIKLIDQDQMTMEEVKAVVDEAHAHKLPVVAHDDHARSRHRRKNAGNLEESGASSRRLCWSLRRHPCGRNYPERGFSRVTRLNLVNPLCPSINLERRIDFKWPHLHRGPNGEEGASATGDGRSVHEA